MEINTDHWELPRVRLELRKAGKCKRRGAGSPTNPQRCCYYEKYTFTQENGGSPVSLSRTSKHPQSFSFQNLTPNNCQFFHSAQSTKPIGTTAPFHRDYRYPRRKRTKPSSRRGLWPENLTPMNSPPQLKPCMGPGVSLVSIILAFLWAACTSHFIHATTILDQSVHVEAQDVDQQPGGKVQAKRATRSRTHTARWR